MKINLNSIMFGLLCICLFISCFFIWFANVSSQDFRKFDSIEYTLIEFKDRCYVGNMINIIAIEDMPDQKIQNIEININNSTWDVFTWINNDKLYKRRKSFINNYWKWEFGNLWLWERASKWMNIDIDVWICIWFAETWLWKRTASLYNVWNVWNNDRWQRKDYESPIDWARWIFFALNNRYLKKYNNISQLSRYGTKHWSVYASSKENWHKNVTKCLSWIKWQQIWDDFIFRWNWKFIYTSVDWVKKIDNIKDELYKNQVYPNSDWDKSSNVSISIDKNLYWWNNKSIAEEVKDDFLWDMEKIMNWLN